MYKQNKITEANFIPLQVVQKGATSENYCATSSKISDKLRFNES